MGHEHEMRATIRGLRDRALAAEAQRDAAEARYTALVASLWALAQRDHIEPDELLALLPTTTDTTPEGD